MSNVCFLSHPVYDILAWQPELRQAWLPGNIAMVVMAVNCIGIGVMENVKVEMPNRPISR